MNRVYVIAEAGVNHNGSIEIAKKLVDAAREAGADAVKFQTFKAEKLVARNARKADYQRKATGSDETQLEMLKRLELDNDAHRELLRYSTERGIEFLSTAFDFESISLLKELGLRTWKIPSGEITNLPYLRAIGSLGMPIILSTGMATLGETESAIAALESSGTDRSAITVLHCTTEYPAPIAEVNLRAMVMVGKAFGLCYGYSDHTTGIAIPIAAVALGASVIEKHFTLDKSMVGPDHKASLNPEELARMVTEIREVEIALGDGIKKPTVSESRNKEIARKSIVASREIQKGEMLSADNLTAKRPGTGISPMEWDNVMGREASRDYCEDDLIIW